MIALDPIVSLSVAIAEAPGSHAFFLGSGASREAGAPTGAEVYWGAVGELYRLANETERTLDDPALQAWLEEVGYVNLGYSGMLALLTPDQAIRRKYLADKFAGIQPGETHERLAEMAVRGQIKVFVTTNFDRLLEHALQARGIDPVIVTCDADLLSAQSREHADCYVLKPHGDYLQETIRNTPQELAALEPLVTKELSEVVDRYGLVMLGYSGSDEAITNVFRARRSRYGLYWVTVGSLGAPAQALVDHCHGRVITRPGSSAFLGDLDGRLRVFAAQPSGLTPLVVHDEVLGLLEREEPIALSAVLRRERLEFEQRLEAVLPNGGSVSPTTNATEELYDALIPVLERRLAGLLPVLLYDPDQFADEVAGVADFRASRPLLGGLSYYNDLVPWCVWWLINLLAAVAVRTRDVAQLRSLFESTFAVRYDHAPKPLVDTFAGSPAGVFGRAIMPRFSDVPADRWSDANWQLLIEQAQRSEVLTERYGEVARNEHEAARSLAEADFVINIASRLRGVRTVAHWTMYRESAEGFARRLHTDLRLRDATADAVGLRPEEFYAKAADALGDGLVFPNPIEANTNAVLILRGT